MVSLSTLMYRITKSRLCPRTGAYECIQDLTQSPFEINRMQISLQSYARGMRRFYERAVPVMSPSLSMISSCGSIPWLKIASRPPPPPILLAPKLFPSDFWRPSSFYAGLSTHTGVKVNHSHISTFFWSPSNSARSPDSTSYMAVMLQECKNTCTRLWIRSIKSAPKIGSLAKAL